MAQITHILLPREKLALYGAEQLSLMELIALLLGTGTKGKGAGRRRQSAQAPARIARRRPHPRPALGR